MLNSFEQERKMTHEQLQQIRAIVYDAYCEGDTEAEWMLVVIDAELAAPEQEPVDDDWTQEDGKHLHEPVMAPVAAPQREWQSLIPDEINNCAGAEIYPSTWAMAFARAIESKLKEKNHG
jgi:hypothetical protein